MNEGNKANSGDKEVSQWLLYFIIPGYSELQIGPFILLMMVTHHQTENKHERQSYVRVRFWDVGHSCSH